MCVPGSASDAFTLLALCFGLALLLASSDRDCPPLVPILEVGEPVPAPPTLPVIRVVLPHTEACDPKHLQPHCTVVLYIVLYTL